jgi:hypothetical protein
MPCAISCCPFEILAANGRSEDFIFVAQALVKFLY